ncbi:DUF1573 domain-containing protein [Neolewinella lacunae]|uniref:DUF1573 domain-containing protein n=1 Tax=Neolewinella lacunae TaxID=1517758 RepID=A0A923PEG9_9BACT|nr:DUF1573 domain-containing protein [Neolewinella lacunae]MBC6992567.1 DUF1573 domain-containing protein [Neolewinella lacunae]MDN3634309.1 DUF1573 domain-containing protein [Neolewinella lacunae]
MKRFFLLFLLASCFTLALQAQVATKPAPVATETSGAKMEFESLEVDYGTIEQDSDPYRVFKFTNTGTEPALITNARGSCGCTVPSYSKAPIAPGESSEIKVRYDTHRVGQFQKRVTLTTNASAEPIILTIKGVVEAKPAQPDAVPAGQQGLFNGGGK